VVRGAQGKRRDWVKDRPEFRTHTYARVKGVRRGVRPKEGESKSKKTLKTSGKNGGLEPEKGTANKGCLQGDTLKKSMVTEIQRNEKGF